MDFELSGEHRMLRDVVRRFVEEELLPLEERVLEREANGEGAYLTPEEKAAIDERSRELELWGLDAPEDVGGFDLPTEAMVGIHIEMGRTIAPYTLPPDSPNLRMLMAVVNDEQRQRYLAPYVQGGLVSAIGISEPNAGSDPSGMTTTAVRDGDHWVLNGRKIWISRAREADFTILMAVTKGDSEDASGSRGGISAFLIDRDTPGFVVQRRIPMIGGVVTYEVALDNCRIPIGNLLGVEGKGFAPMQLRLSTRRLQMACWCIGIAERALKMICDFAPARETFGVPLAERQTIQWWVADAATQLRCARLMAYETAWKLDRGQDVRTEVSMIKVFATEMAYDVIDKAMQVFGAMGMTKELPLQLMSSKVRTMRIYDGPSEVHRWVVARDLLGLKRSRSRQKGS